ncbi:MAG: energy transducer TonB [bacterium]|nr:energy transducer TonB [bacterium]
MTKEIFLSILLHSAVFSIFGVARLQTKEADRSYPAIYTVSIVSGPKTEAEIGGIQVSKPPSPKAKAIKKKEVAKPKEQVPLEKEAIVRFPSGLGIKVSGVSSFGYSYYLNMILSKIGDNWLNPYEGGKKLSAVVYFTIATDGLIEDIKLEKSSGDSYYDQLALRAVYVTKRLPPLPSEFGDKQLKVHLEFECTQ